MPSDTATNAPRLGRIMAMAILITAASTQGVLLLGAGIGDVGPELGIGVAELGLLTALFFGAAAVTSTPAGHLVQRIGWQRAVRIIAISEGTLLLTIAGIAHSLPVLGSILTVMGAVYGMANPAANQALADHVDPNHRGIIFGLKHAGIPTATLLSGGAVPLIILNHGWRTAFVVAALLAFVLPFVVPTGDFQPSAHRFGEDPRRTVEPLERSLLGWLAVTGLLGTISVVGLSTFLVSSLVHDGFTDATAGWIQFSGALFSIASRVTYGWATDRYGGKGFAAVATLNALGGLAFLSFVPASGWWFAVLIGIGFATAWGWPGLFTYSVVNANPTTAAASSALAYSGVFTGAALGPLLVGWIIDRASFETSWVLTAICLLVAAVIMALVGRRVESRDVAAVSAVSGSGSP